MRRQGQRVDPPAAAPACLAAALLLLVAAGALGAATYRSLAMLDLAAPTVAVAEAPAERPVVPPAAPRARPVLVVLIDGLGATQAAALPELRALAAGGARASMRALPP